MKNKLKIKEIFVTIFVIYIASSYLNANLNPLVWGESVRLANLMCIGISLIIQLAIKNN